jgi:hypothetical protein
MMNHRSSGIDREGTQAQSLEGLNKLIKGFRRGELVILTGPTGAFLSHIT